MVVILESVGYHKVLTRYFRKCIRITASDSPNVKAGLLLEQRGFNPDQVDKLSFVLPGVLSWQKYKKMTRGPTKLNEVEASVRLFAEWYKGKELYLYPSAWLDAANVQHELIKFGKRDGKRGLGIDPGEGTAETSWVVVDELGILELRAFQTPDTSVIGDVTLAMMREYKVPPERVCFDRGGGGLQIAHILRRNGYNVRTVGFGEQVAPLAKKPIEVIPYRKRIHLREERQAYVNRRAQLYWELRYLLEPLPDETPFAIPREYAELRRQLSAIPLQYDKEGRCKMPPKNKISEESNETTLVELLGCSPDQADSLCLAVHALIHEAPKPVAGGGVIR